jgi:hypothetical protein
MASCILPTSGYPVPSCHQNAIKFAIPERIHIISAVGNKTGWSSGVSTLSPIHMEKCQPPAKKEYAVSIVPDVVEEHARFGSRKNQGNPIPVLL